MVQNHRLILASGSPRRRELLAGLDLEFTVDTLNSFEEAVPAGMKAEDVPLYMAEGKSLGFHRSLDENEVLLTADTVVIADETLMGKPHDRQQAMDMLRRLSGREHSVLTAVVLRGLGKKINFVDTTLVSFSPLSEEEINYYIDRYRPFDKAGAYGIQEWIGYMGIDKISGSYFNVMGLPVHIVYKALKEEFGIGI